MIEMASTTVEKANAILEWLPLSLSLDRQALSARATSYFSRESHIEKYRAAFRRLGCLVEA